MTVPSADRSHAAAADLEAASDQEQADLEASSTPRIAKLAGAATLLAGAITALTAVQTLTWVRLAGWLRAVPPSLLVLGVATAVIGAPFARGRGWAAIAATAMSGLLALTTSAWLVFSVANALFSLFALGSPVLALAAAGLAAAAIDSCLQVTGARRRLAERGLGFGL